MGAYADGLAELVEPDDEAVEALKLVGVADALT
jgi:hypothetical protein